MKFIISIEGNIGSGKSTLLKKLKDKGLDAIFIQEPVDEWSEIKDDNDVTILNQFYNNQEKYSFPFQMMAYVSRLNNLITTTSKEKHYLFIMERSLRADAEIFEKMLYDDKKLNTYEHQIYHKWVKLFSKNYKSNKTIYIRADPQVSYDRIKTRKRNGEETIPLEYIQKCHDYHEEMIQKINTNEVLILDGNENIYNDETLLNRWFDKIVRFIVQ